jgi:hypothetical protein
LHSFSKAFGFILIFIPSEGREERRKEKEEDRMSGG